ncbi:uncharacterized protein LOC111804400 isoform X1 [Cucurbita pepo subsp. pepo]|uniref:uncharacterized protein LOC111804400 isoform X1 n=1 Tax=Cucurbita pepo subsp. pepo TaxID=3664 RepID=UPI000C9D8F10|nr:uncharacterized protein LOC111804400 isoform X1 [Cucurbita pepo subsp. pepo]XP_023544961.1 uncharacterized protein LOC111804400 isoform X1 [Cucurbita pepo subsp. pepo]
MLLQDTENGAKMLQNIEMPLHKCSQSFVDMVKDTIEEEQLDNSFEASNRRKLDGSYFDESVKTKTKNFPKTNIHFSLKHEILQLEQRLQDQFKVRTALENALGYRSSSQDNTNNIEVPKPATELIKEIAVLELEVSHLEQYLLSLYRKAFDGQISSTSPTTVDEKLKSPKNSPKAKYVANCVPDITSKKEDKAVQSGYDSFGNPMKEYRGICEDKLLDSSVRRCQSSLSHYSVCSKRTSLPEDFLGQDVRPCLSQPTSMVEFAQNASSNLTSLAEYLGAQVLDHTPENANRLSEDMVKCISAIYCKLSDPPSSHHGLSSPVSSSSPTSAFSPQDQYDMLSPGFRNNPSFDPRLDNPFHVEGLKEFSGPYSTMVEVPWIYRDSQKLIESEHLLQDFRSLISKLEEVDPRKLNHEEKLAFWINVHNSLMMHAYLAYGVPQNNMKKVFVHLKAAYNIGGQTISVHTIQSSILGCRMPRPGQWLSLLIPSKSRFKSGDKRQAYKIHRSEPLLHFALSTGCHSDPAVRVYTPKRVLQELETAKDEYIRATFGIRKDKKVILPKIIELFAKESSLCTAGMMEMIQKSLPESLRRGVSKYQNGKSRKNVEWMSHDFSFRYLISREMVN